MINTLSKKLNISYSWVTNEHEFQFGGLKPLTRKPLFGLLELEVENNTNVLVGAALMNLGRSAIADSTYPYQVASLYLVSR